MSLCQKVLCEPVLHGQSHAISALSHCTHKLTLQLMVLLGLALVAIRLSGVFASAIVALCLTKDNHTCCAHDQLKLRMPQSVG